jgi:hypothetical protein
MLVLKDECKKRGFTVHAFLCLVPVPAQTIRDWCKKKPDLVIYLLSVSELSAQVNNLKADLSQFQIVKDALLNAERHNEFLTSKLNDI